ncbi:MAG: DUF5686 and carboxypeptidase regulatory-like domain-containing protein [Saprospiraceae bacterium]|nr:DUF5686 and carboxypeptidase regulatory-like domain-containing protein [Saprospiraceae bacterium]
MNRLIGLLFFLFVIVSTHAQITVKGRVVDTDTKEGLPFSSVYFQGTTIGTSTDIDGYYELYASKPYDSIAVSAIGYQTTLKLVSSDTTQTINFFLSSSDITLQEVVILAGENPANQIVRNIIEKKKANRLDNLNSFQFESYEKVELDLENISEELRESRLMKPFAFIFDNVDSTSDEKPFLPVYINEVLSDVFYVKEEGSPKEIVKGQRTSGVRNKSIVDYIKRIHTDYSVYDDWIYILEKPFASPFSDGGLFYYDYYIIDSTFIKDQWSYKLKFKPKRKQENTFYGDFWVADTTFAIERLNMRMSKDANINLVSRVIIFQEFDTLANYWVPLKEKLVVDFTATKNAPGVIGRHTQTFKDHRLNQIGIQDVYNKVDPDYDSEEEEIKDEAFWNEVRHEPLSENEQSVYGLIDSIKSVPIFKTYAQVLETIFTGYYEFGNWELGPYFSVYSSNPVEGNRLRLGARTNSGFSKSMRFGGFLAYGFKDKDFKYGGQFDWMLNKKPRIIGGLAYKKDISLNSENSETFQDGDLFSGTFRRNIYQKLIQVEEAKVYFERYWKNGFSNRLTLLHRYMDPYGNLTAQGAGFNYAFLPDQNALTDVDTTIRTTEFIFKTRYAYKENYVDAGYERVSLGSKYPIIELQYTLGAKGVLNSDYNYHKLSLFYRHYFLINPIGWTSYRFKAGKIFGTLPFLLAEVHPGNEAYFSSRGAFNTMNRYEFASDTYFSLFLEHHFDGYLMNKIPLIRKLQLRTLISFKAVIGSLSEKNKNANLNYKNDFSQIPDFQTYTGFRTPDRTPFMEAGVGIENIFKVFRVEAMWRLNYLDNPEATKFNLLVGVAFYF